MLLASQEATLRHLNNELYCSFGIMHIIGGVNLFIRYSHDGICLAFLLSLLLFLYSTEAGSYIYIYILLRQHNMRYNTHVINRIFLRFFFDNLLSISFVCCRLYYCCCWCIRSKFYVVFFSSDIVSSWSFGQKYSLNTSHTRT